MSKNLVKSWTTKSGLNAFIFLIKDSHHCGYVVLPACISDFDFDEELIDVHGGITYSGNPDWSGGLTVIGYDCAHAGDQCFGYKDGVWRDVDFCTDECEKLASQLISLTNRNVDGNIK
ncbi:TPA: hypothetical protein ACF3JC_002816 [Enterobacter hormaechei]|uniref:hypothetical protein n=1 Tax=Enterobacter hormaechei TaxID=158836 RepID=UPI0014954A7F|nr:hypothetical protein [Enterobacter hormaechei]MCK1035045.1 hypothetical protein [Enterobacter hormaechei subsp. xiangfangensis]HAT7673645.1 hypothetical protein [Enterobacter hormaechei subsp. xiangfangensis]